MDTTQHIQIHVCAAGPRHMGPSSTGPTVSWGTSLRVQFQSGGLCGRADLDHPVSERTATLRLGT